MHDTYAPTKMWARDLVIGMDPKKILKAIDGWVRTNA